MKRETNCEGLETDTRGLPSCGRVSVPGRILARACHRGRRLSWCYFTTDRRVHDLLCCNFCSIHCRRGGHYGVVGQSRSRRSSGGHTSRSRSGRGEIGASLFTRVHEYPPTQLAERCRKRSSWSRTARRPLPRTVPMSGGGASNTHEGSQRIPPASPAMESFTT